MKEETINNRNTILIVIVIAVILFAFYFVFISPNKSISKAPASSEIEFVIGEEEAPNEMVIYLDPLCDRCYQFKDEVMSELYNNEVKNGKLKIKIRPLSIVSKYSQEINVLEICAAKQADYLDTTNLIGKKLFKDYKEGDDIDSLAYKFLESEPKRVVTEQLEIDRNILSDCMEDSSINTKLSNQDDAADEANIYSTPTIYINGNEPMRGYAQIEFIRGQMS